MNLKTKIKMSKQQTTTKQGFTPGPWEMADYITGLLESNRSLAVWPIPHERKPICLITPKGSETDTDVANATLIAAAPELFEALERLLPVIKKYMSDDPYEDQIIELAESALSKALPLTDKTLK